MILHATIVSVTDGLILTNQTINIEGRTIRSVAANGPPLTGARIVDATGRFVIPGLWDMHAHLEFTGASSLQLYVANGVTGVRDMGSSLDTVLGYRESTQSGVVLGPRIVAAGPSLRQSDTDASPYRTHHLWVDTAADGRAVVQMLKRRGVDFIKVHGLVPRDAYFAIAEEARAQGLPLVGHLPDKITFDEAIDAGQIGFEHMNDMAIWTACSGPTVYREESCRAYFEGLGRRGIWETPTLLAYRERLSPNAPASDTGKEQLVYATRSLKAVLCVAPSQTAPRPADYRHAEIDRRCRCRGRERSGKAWCWDSRGLRRDDAWVLRARRTGAHGAGGNVDVERTTNSHDQSSTVSRPHSDIGYGSG